jgi:GxxExxY protein
MNAAKNLADIVRETAYKVHVYLGVGFLEKVYENALVNRLRKSGHRVEQQVTVKVYDEDGAIIGDYVADLLVDGSLLIELKAVKTLLHEHEAQLINYLKATKIKHGMLINFGSQKFEIRKYVY